MFIAHSGRKTGQKEYYLSKQVDEVTVEERKTII